MADVGYGGDSRGMRPRQERVIMEPHPDSGGNRALRALERVIAFSHRITRKRSHPYFVAMDAAAICGAVATATLTARLSRPQEGVVFAALLLLVFYFPVYPALLAIKRALGARGSRSTLFDSLILVPLLVLSAAWCGIPVGTVSTVLAIVLPLTFAITRIGCFLGGCHYGRPHALGVRYRPEDLVSRHRWWRSFTPDPWPAERVLPLNLIDAGFQLLVSGSIAAAVLTGVLTQDVSWLLVYLGLYSAFRMVSDPLRGPSRRRTIGSLSATQWLSASIMAVATTVVALT